MGRLSRGEEAVAEAEAAAAATAAAAAAVAVTTKATQAGSYTVVTTAVAASCVLSAREPGPHNSIHCCGLHNSNQCIVCTHCQGGAAAAVVTTVSWPPRLREQTMQPRGCWCMLLLVASRLPSRAPSRSPRVSGGLLGVATDHWTQYYHTMGPGNNTHLPTAWDVYAQTLWKYHLTTKK